MKIPRVRHASVVASIALLCGTARAAEDEGPPNPEPLRESLFHASFSAGLATPGVMYVGSHDYDTTFGLTVRVAGDWMFSRHWSVGGELLVAGISVDRPSASLPTLSLGIAAKAHISAGSVTIRPGISAAYHHSRSDVDTFTSSGIGLTPMLEAAFPMSEKLNLLATLSTLYQPLGGNDRVDVHLGPIAYIAVGVELR